MAESTRVGAYRTRANSATEEILSLSEAAVTRCGVNLREHLAGLDYIVFLHQEARDRTVTT